MAALSVITTAFSQAVGTYEFLSGLSASPVLLVCFKEHCFVAPKTISKKVTIIICRCLNCYLQLPKLTTRKIVSCAILPNVCHYGLASMARQAAFWAKRRCDRFWICSLAASQRPITVSTHHYYVFVLVWKPCWKPDIDVDMKNSLKWSVT